MLLEKTLESPLDCKEILEKRGFEQFGSTYIQNFSIVNTTVLYSVWLVESVEMEESDTKGDSLYTVIHYV